MARKKSRRPSKSVPARPAKKSRAKRSPRKPPAPPVPPAEDPAIVAARTKALQDAFLEQLKASGNVSSAARLAGIHRDTHYEWRKTDAAYAKAFVEAEEASIDVLETEARRRALLGVDKPVYFKGEKIDTLKEYSDTLLIFLLKGRRPEVYRERFEHFGRGGGPIQTQNVPIDGLTDEELALVRTLMERGALTKKDTDS